MVALVPRRRFPNRNTLTPWGKGRCDSCTPLHTHLKGWGMMAPKLVIGPVGMDAARYAAHHWHYSGCLPAGKLMRIGVWEDGDFIGVVVFSRGTNAHLFNLVGAADQTECVELTRVALRHDHQSTVTHIVAKAIAAFREESPGVRAIVSYADPGQGHHGGIYQAGGWTYIGTSTIKNYIYVDGERYHPRSAGLKFGTQSYPALRKLGHNAIKGPDEYLFRYAIGFDRRTRNNIARAGRKLTPPTKDTADAVRDRTEQAKRDALTASTPTIRPGKATTR